MRNRLFTIIFVDLECTCWYLSYNVVYVLKKLVIIFTCKGPLIWDWAGSGAFFWSKFLQIKLDISVGCYFTVYRAKKIAEISSVLPENKEMPGDASSHSHIFLPSSLPPHLQLQHHGQRAALCQGWLWATGAGLRWWFSLTLHDEGQCVFFWTVSLAILCKLGWKKNYKGIKRVSHRKRENERHECGGREERRRVWLCEEASPGVSLFSGKTELISAIFFALCTVK